MKLTVLIWEERARRPWAPASPTGTRSQWSDASGRCSSTDCPDDPMGTSWVAGEACGLPAVPDSKHDEVCQGRLSQIFSISSGPPKGGTCCGPDTGRATVLTVPTQMQVLETRGDSCWAGEVAGAQGSKWLHHPSSAYCTPRREDQIGTPRAVPS